MSDSSPSVRWVVVVIAPGCSSRTRAANPAGSGTASILLNTGKNRAVGQVELGEDALDHVHLAFPIRMARIHHMNENVGVAGLLERGAEARYQMVGQLPDEADRIGHPRALTLAQLDFACQGVERREESILHHDLVLAGERPENARLAGVGVTHQCDAQHRIAARAKVLAMALHTLELGLEPLDALPDDATVGLELGFARSPETDTAADAREVGPHPGQPREEVFQLRQLDLKLGFVAARPGGEDVEDDFGPVHYANPKLALEVGALHGTQLLVEDDE